MPLDTQSFVKYDLLRSQSDPFTIETGITILYELKGHATISTADRSEVIRTGDLMAVSPMQLFSIQSGHSSVLLRMLIHPSVLRLTETDDAGVLNCRISSEENSEDVLKIRQLLAALLRICVNHGKESELRPPVMELVIRLYEGYAVRAGDTQKYSMRNLKLIDAVLAEIKTKWQEPLSIREIAAGQFVSASYLTRCFKSYTGFGFHECLTEVRMGHAVDELRYSEKSITEIALDNGFSNVNSFIGYFRQKYSLTPGTWRKTFRDLDRHPDSRQEEYEPDGIMDALLRYDTNPHIEKRTWSVGASIQLGRGEPVKPAWKEILNAGYAHDVLLSPLQKQIHRAQKEIGFTYLRVKGILDDDMSVCRVKEDGNLQVGFHFLDRLTDLILSEGLIPMLEFSWIPRDLVRKEFRFFDARESVMSPPKDLALWEKLIAEVVCHWVLRYGEEEVARWKFTMPMFNAVPVFSQAWSYEEYLQMYLVARRGVKQISESFQLGGFGFYTDVAMDENMGLRFLRELRERDALPDFLTVQCQSHEIAVADKDFYIYTADQSHTPSTVSADVDFVAHFLQHFRKILAKEQLDHLPVYLEEWTCTLWQRDLSGDTIFRASWLCRNILQNRNAVSGIGYWLLTDWLTEWRELRSLYHGGYGLLTQNGIAKASYRVLQMLARLGTDYIDSGEGWYVSRSGKTCTIMLYHYCHYEELYRLRYKRLEDPRQAYEIFRNPGEVHYELRLNGFESGLYRMQEETLSRNSGSSFDEWLRMGAPKELTAQQEEWLEQVSMPSIRQSYRQIDQTLQITAELEPNDVRMITLVKVS